MRMHANQLTVTVETARGLVDAQFPDWRGLRVEEIVSGFSMWVASGRPTPRWIS